jgi:hypothetical protein
VQKRHVGSVPSGKAQSAARSIDRTVYVRKRYVYQHKRTAFEKSATPSRRVFVMLSAALFVLPIATASMAGPSSHQVTACPSPQIQLTKSGPAKLFRLDDLPQAHLQLAVQRTIHGCQVASIRENGATYYVPVTPVNNASQKTSSNLEP